MAQSLGVKLYPLLFLTGIVFVLFLTGKVNSPWPQRESANPPKSFRELNELVEATNRSESVLAAQSVFALLRTAEGRGGAGGARLIRAELPALVARVEADAPRYHERLGAIEIETSEGRRCREGLLLANEEKRWFLNSLADDVGRSRSTWPVVHRFKARWKRWIAAQGMICNFNL